MIAGSRWLRVFFTIAMVIIAVVVLLMPWIVNAVSRRVGDRMYPGSLFIVTIPPLRSILDEVVGDQGHVECLLQPGESPHTYEPRPSNMAMVANSRGLFYVDDSIDSWVSSFSGVPKIPLFHMVPESMRLVLTGDHSHGDDGHSETDDPHFWTSPQVVKAILPSLVEALAELDPDSGEIFRSNAEEFAAELDSLDEEITRMLSPFEGEPLIMFHPSFGYFMDAYNLEVAGLIEPSPGQEPSPGHIIDLIHIAEELGVRAIFTEPQLPEAPARTLAEETGLPVYILDPLGGVEGRKTYSELMRYNAEVISRALSIE